MTAGPESDNHTRLRKIGFVGLSIVLLAGGIFGLTRLRLRAAVPFAWEIRQRQIVVLETLPNGLLPGDILLGNDQTPLRHGEELEFLFDGKQAGDVLALTVLRNGQSLALNIPVQGHWYSLRYVISNLLLGFFLWGIGTWVLLRHVEDKAARSFFLLALNFAVGIMLTTARLPAGTPPYNYFLPVIYHLVYPFFPAQFLHFATLFPREKKLLTSSARQNFLIYLPAVVFVVLLEFFNLRAIFSGDLAQFRDYHQVFTVHRGYVVLYCLLAIAVLAHSYRTAVDNIERNKVRWILWGIAAGLMPFVFLWTIPKIIVETPLIPEELAFAALILAPLSFAFAILKYKIFDIEVVINRSIVYSLLTGFIVGLYLLLVGLTGNFFYAMSPQANSFVAIVCTLIAALLFNPAKQKIQNLVDMTFYRVKYNYRLATREFSQMLVTMRSQAETLELLMLHVEASVPVEKIAVLLPQQGAYEVAASRGVQENEKNRLAFSEHDAIIQLAQQQRLPLAKAGSADPSVAVYLQLLQNFDQTAMEILLPVEISTGEWSFLLLGRKRSGARYEVEDLELLSMLAGEAFSAVERLRFQEAAIQEHAEKEKLAAISQLKSEFIALVSHELRTPLTAIRWSVQNLLDGIPEKPTPKIENYLRGIYDSSSHLSRMIENLLDVGKIEADKIELFPERLPLKQAIAAVLQLLAPVAAKKNIRLQMGAPTDLHVQADRDALQEILSNLLENAIKYSPEGKTVSLEARLAENDDRAIAISVRDAGVGIAPEKQKNIFEKFERVTQDRATREKGLGLGLYIVKKLVEAQNGAIEVESEVGKGSRFTIHLPAA